jgi:hypothetical protein
VHAFWDMDVWSVTKGQAPNCEYHYCVITQIEKIARLFVVYCHFCAWQTKHYAILRLTCFLVAMHMNVGILPVVGTNLRSAQDKLKRGHHDFRNTLTSTV